MSQTLHRVETGQLVRWGGALVAGLALLLYLLPLPLYPVVGPSAALLDLHLGLNPYPALTHPAWSLVVRIVDLIPLGTVTQRMNYFSAVCGALSVWLFYVLTLRYNLARPLDRDDDVLHVFRSMAAAGFLAVSIPFWIVSTRAHPMSFDLLLLLLVALILSAYHRTGNIKWLRLFAFCFGLGAVEYVTFYSWTIPAGILVLLTMRTHGQLRAGHTAGVLSAGALGLCAYGVAVAVQFNTPAMEWLSIDDRWELLRGIWIMQIHSLVRTHSGAGWLVVLFVSVIPWVCCLAWSRVISPFTVLNAEALLHAVALSIAIAVLLNAPIAPWRFFASGSEYVVMPYVLLASVFGYTIGYWISLFEARRRWSKHPAKRWSRLVAGLTPVLVLLGAARAYPVMHPGASAGYYEWGRRYVECLQGRTLVVTDGIVDPLLRLIAHESDQDIIWLNESGFRNRWYRSYVASLFDDARLKSMAGVGLMPLMKEYIRRVPTAVDNLAVKSQPQLWSAIGCVPVPSGMVYLGESTRDRMDTAALIRLNEAAWSSLPSTSVRFPEHNRDLSLLASHSQSDCSRVANDLGVFLEHVHAPAEAREAYTAALRLDPGNVSALLNLFVMSNLAEGERSAEELSTLHEELTQKLSAIRLPPRLIVARFGEVYSPVALMRILELQVESPEERMKSTPRELQVAAHAYASGDRDRAADLLDELVVAHPRMDEAWFLRGIVSANAGRDDAWDECVEYMRERGRVWLPFIQIQGDRHLRRGDVQAARRFYELGLTYAPGHIELMRSLMILEIAHGSKARAREVIRAILSIDPSNADANTLLGVLQSGEGQYEEALSSLQRAVETKPAAASLNNLAWVYLQLNKPRLALEAAREALELTDQMPELWDTYGAALLELGQIHEAENATRIAFERNPEKPEHVLHRAVVLHRLGREEEAALLFGAIDPNEVDFDPLDQNSYQRLRADLEK